MPPPPPLTPQNHLLLSLRNLKGVTELMLHSFDSLSLNLWLLYAARPLRVLSAQSLEVTFQSLPSLATLTLGMESASFEAPGGCLARSLGVTFFSCQGF